MRILLTAGPTREPIDPVRYISNRSSGRMGAAIAEAAIRAGHAVTAILGPIGVPFPPAATRVDVETAAEMLAAVLEQFSCHDLLIMAAAVADYRPIRQNEGKIGRHKALTIECEATEDIVAAASRTKRPNQRTVGFALEGVGGVERAREKLVRKNLDLIVFNPLQTMDSPTIEPVLLYASGRSEPLPPSEKSSFAEFLVRRAESLFA